MSNLQVNRLSTKDGSVDIEVRNLLVRDSAMENLGDYEEGLELKTVQQYFIKDGHKFVGKAFQLPIVLTGNWDDDKVLVETYGEQWDHSKLFNKDIPNAHDASAIGYRIPVDGSFERNQQQRNIIQPSLWDFMSDEEIADSQTGDPKIDTSAAWNSLFSAYRDGEVVIPRGYYKISSVELFRKGHFPVAGGFTINAKGAVIAGDGEFIINSCKRVTINGLDAPSVSKKLRGCWYSSFNDCRFHEIVFGDQPGINFTATYWNNWNGGSYQRLVTDSNATGGFNANTFYGVAWRGDATQGFTKAVPNMLVFEAQQDVQDLNFYGGDISYYSGGIYHIEEPIDEDISVTFNGVYLDSHGIPPIDGVKRSIRVINCHVAGKINFYGSLKGALRGSQTVWGNEHTAGWQSYGAYNLIPNGDMGQSGVGVTGTNNGPLGSTGAPSATVSWEKEGEWNYININQPSEGATPVRFRALPLPFTGVYSAAFLIRSRSAGTTKLDIGINGQYGAFDVGQDWAFVTMSANSELVAGTTNDILLRGNQGAAYDVDVMYVALVPGTHPPMFNPPHPKALRSDSVTTTEVIVGKTGVLNSRPRLTGGSGNPLGAVALPRGSVFFRTDGRVSSSAAVKTGDGVNSWRWLQVRDALYTVNRPTGLTNTSEDIGYQAFDRDLRKPIWWSGTKWVDALGNDV